MIKIKKRWEIPESEVTPESLYRRRREFIKSAGVIGGALLLNPLATVHASYAVDGYQKTSISLDEEITEENDATSYNNFYELGTGKSDPKVNARYLKTDPWSVTVDGEVSKPGTYALEDLLAPHAIEERTYRLRCVEAWSMVIPWNGIPLGDVLKRFEPTSRAKYVAFTSILDPKNLPGQRRSVLDWPYVEGLRIDEAMHPLTLLAVGLYGKIMPNQNGAPIRLVVPWKYGFKSAKSIVRITLTEEQPPTAWNLSNAREYGFYSNVNPEVNHPRWSQAKERRIGEFFKRPTLPFNGYGDQVASLYSGMDLKADF